MGRALHARRERPSRRLSFRPRGLFRSPFRSWAARAFAVVFAIAAGLALSTPAQAQSTVIWSATMTVGEGTEGSRGYDQPNGYDYGSIDELAFTFASTGHTVLTLARWADTITSSWGNSFELQVLSQLDSTAYSTGSDGLILEVAGEELPLSAATRILDTFGQTVVEEYRWDAAWLAVNAPSLSSANYQTTLGIDDTVAVCLRTRGTDNCLGEDEETTLSDDASPSALVEMAVRPWLSRFGRMVATHEVDAVSDRLGNPPKNSQVTLGGHKVNPTENKDGAAVKQALTAVARSLGAPGGPPAGGDDLDGFHGSGPEQAWAGHGPGSGDWRGGVRGGVRGPDGFPAGAGAQRRQPSGREVLRGSSFHLAKEDEESGLGLAAWGRVTVSGFDGEEPAEDGNARIDGDVTTGIIGADVERDRVLAGVAVSVSDGEGTFEQPGEDSGKIRIESTMTTVSPYARYMVSDRVSVWGLAGLGTGDMTIVPEADGDEAERTRTDIAMRLAAIGGRGALLEAGDDGGIDLALKADAFHVRTEADPIEEDEGKTTANASRVRLALEGSRSFRREDGSTFTPGLELGLRHDGGDAETGTGLELGSLVRYEDPETGLGVEARLRALVAHDAANYREWGAHASVRLRPGKWDRGLSFSLAPTYGAAASGVDRLWSARDARGLAPGGGSGKEFEAGQRLEGELGYGFGHLGGRLTGTPNVGFGVSDNTRDYRVGWRLTPAVRGYPGFRVNLDATRREAANDDEPPEHGVILRGAIRW